MTYDECKALKPGTRVFTPAPGNKKIFGTFCYSYDVNGIEHFIRLDSGSVIKITERNALRESRMNKFIAIASLIAVCSTSSFAKAEKLKLVNSRVGFTKEQLANLVVCVGKNGNLPVINACAEKVGYVMIPVGTDVDMHVTRMDGIYIMDVLSGQYAGSTFWILQD